MALTNVERYAIQGMVGQGIPVAAMAKSLKVSEKTIENYLNKLGESFDRLLANNVAVVPQPSKEEDPTPEVAVEKVEKVEEAKPEEYVPEITRIEKLRQETVEKPRVVSAVPEGLTKKLMLNTTGGKKHKAVSIMTEGASAVSDDAKKSMQLTNRSRTARGAIYNIEEKKVD